MTPSGHNGSLGALAEREMPGLRLPFRTWGVLIDRDIVAAPPT
jgi:hypothetical protein